MIQYRKNLNELLPPHPITVELGVAEGNFSLDILRNWSPSKHYMVDTWATVEVPGDGSFKQEWHDKNYKSVRHIARKFKQVVILRGLTVDMAVRVPDNTVDCISVDACHSYGCVVADINAWWPKLKTGGIMAFHDYQNTWDYGVNQAVKEFAIKKGLTIYDIPENKIEDAGAYLIK